MNTTPTSLTARQNDLLTFFLLNEADPAKLREHFNLTPREFIEFLASPAVTHVLDSIAVNIKGAVHCIAAHATHVAMDHLRAVCAALANAPEQITQLRLASSTLGRLASSFKPRRAPTQLDAPAPNPPPPPDAAPTPSTPPLPQAAAPTPPLPAPKLHPLARAKVETDQRAVAMTAMARCGPHSSPPPQVP